VKLRPADRVRFRCATVPDEPLLDAEDADERFDLVVAFGLFHHVAGADRRRELLVRMAEATRPGGLVVATIWRFGRERRFAGRGRPPPEEIAAAEGRAVVLDFDGRGERLCIDIPVGELERHAAGVGLDLRDRFDADGRSGALNRYLVYARPTEDGAGSSTPNASS